MDITAQNAGDFFFPLRKTLKLFKENYSPDLLRKVIHAGATSSFENASENLKVYAEVDISASHIQRLVTRIGGEFTVSDDHRITEILPEESNSQDSLEVVSVSVDGGRAQKRERDCGPGVHNPVWVETKVAALQILKSRERDKDPHPELPKAFKDRKTVRHLVDGLKGHSAGKSENNKHDEDTMHIKCVKAKSNYGPEVISRSVAASLDNADDFGKLLFHKVHEQQLHKAPRKAFLGDGDRKLWTIYEDNFKAEGWTPVLDFVHTVEYAFEAAKLVTDNEDKCWIKYIGYASHIWQGRVLTVIRSLDKFLSQTGPPGSEVLKEVKRLREIRNYFKNNYTKMNYPSYRKKGLPVSTCHVESLIKQMNMRVKSTEKFWNGPALKGILKLKASLLSTDDSWQRFWNARYERQANTLRNYVRKMAA
jgi:hypothetical protein